jgi:elongation factor 2
VLRQALTEKIKPVLMINKIDRGILELQVDGETMYQNFCRVIENANVIISTYECEDMGETQQVDPTLGSVSFGSALFGWAFTITRFAHTYSKKFNVPQEKLMKKFWGDNYFNPEEKKFTTDSNIVDGKPLPRCFVQFIMRPIISMCRNIFDENLDGVWKMCDQLELKLKNEEKEYRQKPLFKCIF